MKKNEKYCEKTKKACLLPLDPCKNATKCPEKRQKLKNKKI